MSCPLELHLAKHLSHPDWKDRFILGNNGVQFVTLHSYQALVLNRQYILLESPFHP